MPTYPVRPSGAWVVVVESDVACAAFVTEFLQEAGYWGGGDFVVANVSVTGLANGFSMAYHR